MGDDSIAGSCVSNDSSAASVDSDIDSDDDIASFELGRFPGADVFSGSSLALRESEDRVHLYQSLEKNYIRLVKILPGQPKSEVCCEMHEHILSEDLEYIALSYRWGPPPETCTMRLNGQLILVRKSLWRFLRHARGLKTGTLGLLWIDALCINQNDLNERAQQLGLMPRIYKTAGKVVIWLGPAYHSSDDAMQDLAAAWKPGPAKQRVMSIYGKRGSMGISMLCHRPYWTRLWIFQEVILAQRVLLMCGGKVAFWEPLRDLLVWVKNNLKTTTLPRRLKESFEYQTIRNSPAMFIVPAVLQKQDDNNLYDLMLHTKSLLCAERLDRVYALLGVVSQGLEEVNPDYSIPIPVLVSRILKAHHKVKPPSSLERIEETCQWITKLLDVPTATAYELVDGYGVSQSPSDDYRKRFSLGHGDGRLDLLWAWFYGHGAVEDVLRRSLSGKKKTDWLKEAVELGAIEILQWTLEDRSGSRCFHGVNDDHGYLATVDGAYCYDTYRLALETASTMGCEEAASMLLEAEMDPDMKFAAYGEQYRWCPPPEIPFGWLSYGRALFFAWEEGHQTIVSMLLKAAIEFNALHLDRSRSFRDGMDIAACKGDEELMRVLLDAHATPFLPNMGWPAGLEVPFSVLKTAAEHGHLGAVQVLMDRGVEITEQSFYGVTVLWHAADHGQLEMVRFLVDAGADVNVVCHDPGLSCATSGAAIFAASRHGHEELVQWLIDAGANVNACSNVGYKGNALIAACSGGHVAIVRILIDAEADVNAQGREEHYDGSVNALYVASLHGNAELVQILAEAGADVNAVTEDERGRVRTALSTASAEGHVETVQLLLDAGADPRACNAIALEETSGEPGRYLDVAAQEALRQRWQEVERLLIAYGALKATPLGTA